MGGSLAALYREAALFVQAVGWLYSEFTVVVPNEFNRLISSGRLILSAVDTTAVLVSLRAPAADILVTRILQVQSTAVYCVHYHILLTIHPWRPVGRTYDTSNNNT